MSAFDGIVNNKLNGAIGNTSPDGDAIFGFIAGGVATASYTLGDIVTLLSPADAVAVEIDAAYDANNQVLVYHHITEFFRLMPTGKLYLKLVAQTVTMTEMVDKANVNHLMDLVLNEQTNREIKGVMVVLNPAVAYVPVFTNGIDDDIEAAIPKAQELVNELDSRSIHLDVIILEGKLAAATTLADLPDLRAGVSPNISLVIGQDPGVAALDALYANYASTGSAAGMIAIRKVSECVGSVDIEKKPRGMEGKQSYPLTGAGIWESAALSSGHLFSAIDPSTVKSLDDKGYIFVGKYEGYAGYYFNDSHTCIALTDDYSYIEMNRVWNKAARKIRAVLLPKMKSTIDFNEDGTVAATTIASWETLAQKQLTAMRKAGEISSGEVVFDPKANVMGGDPFVSLTTVIPRGIARSVINNLGFSNPSN